MKLQLDTTAKTIKIEEAVKLNDLVEILDKLLPENAWKEYKLETNTTIVWNSQPTIIYRDRWPYVNPYTNPLTPIWQTNKHIERQYDVTCGQKNNLLNFEIQ